MVGIADFIVSLIILLPPIAVALIAFANKDSFTLGAASTGVIAALVLTFCCAMAILIPLSLLVNGVLCTYLQSMWTLTYRRLTDLMKPALPAQMEVIEPQ